MYQRMSRSHQSKIEKGKNIFGGFLFPARYVKYLLVAIFSKCVK